ncbi:zinc finger and SCAN domain-containing protein 29-like [Gadus chalcogrammus]|uniref:zinc finger and SCAN domain-containing protein 29-like n=1 Tax=Gadus chalcogrammus TaxID=1042646 RepID=UPI0024C4AD34|nr:zinc finger and SCAN domain-containing protein 29-like [Gadus chalcogrammus]
MAPKTFAWSNKEVETFLGILGEVDVQRELDGAVRNEKVFQQVSGRMAIAGYEKNTEQCRRKFKKLRAEYRKVKDHKSRSGVDRKMWKWFDIMDAIYGHRPASRGREGAIDTDTSLLESMLEPTGVEPRCQEVPDSAFPEDEDMGSSRCVSPTPPPRTSTPVPAESAALCSTTNPTYPWPFAFVKRSRASDVAASIREMQASEERRQEREEERLDHRHRVAREEALQDAMDARLHEDQRAMQQIAQVAAFNTAFLQSFSQFVQAFGHGDPVP